MTTGNKVITYVLKCQNNKYYIGQSTVKTLNDTIKRDFLGKSNRYTLVYPPLKIEREYDLSHLRKDITELTKVYMKNYGVENVRNCITCEITLSKYYKKYLLEEVEKYKPRCSICFSPNHIDKDCIYNTNVCYYCGERGHNFTTCENITKGSFKKIDFLNSIDKWY